MPVKELNFGRDGAWHLPACVGPAEQGRILAALESLPAGSAGVRIYGAAELRPLLARDGSVGAVASAVLGGACRPVRAVLFDKSQKTNWGLGWHQDRTIAVAARVDVPGFGPWTVKAGVVHVAPPFEVLERMVTLRVHLDAVPESNAPLLVALGSHRLGRIAEGDVARVVSECARLTCTAEAGDIWLYATPILHASDAAALPSRRRVLQIDYADFDLPSGLEWFGI